MSSLICLKLRGGYESFLQLLILVTLTGTCAGTSELSSTASDFSKHDVVHPVIHHSRTKRELSSTRDTNGTHHSEVQVTVPVDGESWVLQLRLNEDLVTEGHTLQYQEGGKTVKHIPTKEELDLCHYSGSVQGKPKSWAAVSTCRGVRGVIFDGEKMRYIEPAQDAEIQSLHYLYDHKDIKTERFQRPGHQNPQPATERGVGDGINNTVYDPLLLSHRRDQDIMEVQRNRYKREIDNLQVREPYNANKLSRYVELVLVADHSMFKANGGDKWAVHSQLAQLANIVNSFYAPLNIYIALVGVVVWSERDKIPIVQNSMETLSDFLKYRENNIILEIPHDNAHLLTHMKFYDGVVGKAFPHSMCKLQSSGGVEVMFDGVIGLQAATVAHEMGHNFGMVHDEECEISRCADEKCIMSMTSTSLVPVRWSYCSQQALKKSFEKGLDYCLHNKPERLAESRTCGNGFVEPGEQCDCGVTAGGGVNPCHACCDPDTCMLRSNATCGAGACCDLTTCRLRSAGIKCRSADRECDLPEYCTGHSEYCPADVYKMDSTPCSVGNDEAYCMGGSCRTHSDQCRLLWGATGKSDDECYTKNTAGTREGHCGHDFRSGYTACAQSDTLCGLLQCSGEHNWLEHAMGYGRDSGADAHTSSYVRNRVRFDCFTANFNLGANNVDLALVPDGAKCGHDQMCLRQKCTPVAAVRERVAALESSVCPSNCSGHGLCNSEGHCHCDEGFAPPQCSARGPGGSVDSGPATKPIESYGNSRPVKPSNSYETSRPVKPSNSYVTSRPVKPSNDYFNSRSVKPNGGYVTPRPVRPSNDYVNPGPVKPSNGYITQRPVRPSNGYVTRRPVRPSNGYVTQRPVRPSNGYVTRRPVRPSNGYVTRRPVRPSNGYVTQRPVRPSNGYVTQRPVRPSNGYVTQRPVKPSNGYVTQRPVRPSNGYVTQRPVRPSNGYVTLRPVKPNNSYITQRPVRPSNGYVTLRPVKPSNGYVTQRPVRPSNGYITPKFNNGYDLSKVKPKNGYIPRVNPRNDFDTSKPVKHSNSYITSSTVKQASSSSIDFKSTPGSKEKRNFEIMMYAIFLGIIPSIILLLFLVYYLKHNTLLRETKKCCVSIACFKNYSNFIDKRRKKSIIDDIYTEETDKDGTEKPTLPIAMVLNKTKITKDDIQVVTNDGSLNLVDPDLRNDDILTAVSEIKLKPVKPAPKINEVENYILSGNNYVNFNSIKRKTQLAPKIVTPALNTSSQPQASLSLKIENDDMQEVINDATLKRVNLSKTNINDIQTAINNIKLKSVKPTTKTDNNDKIATNVKLKPVLKINKNDIQVEDNDVKSKHVRPLVAET